MADISAPVTFENFARIESERMFTGIAASAGGTNVWNHIRVPTPVDEQTVIRMNRDTLYSAAIIDVSAGATITVPDTGGRYLSVMLVNRDHFINRVLHEAGTYELTAAELGSDFVCAAVRILVDPNSPADVAEVNRLQDQLDLTSVAGGRFEPTVFDAESFTQTREALLVLARGLVRLERCFGRREDVDPIRHLLGTAYGWGGLPETEASYLTVEPSLPVGEYTLTVGEVPVDGFWSISLYNAEGYFEPNESDAYSVNSVTGVRDADGSITVRFGGDPSAANHLPLTEGWNYTVRLYRPHTEIIDGRWSFPTITPSA
ncbi:DUF1214 domain-containing protein [Gordonia sp. (in: high G+C Gram-positive bacteria)]|uniref:DUF1214 domain-containing protein n=1 Tax=Gordonia sp. (in: high G+C Gram-positive bacteria) TaxID=84139 RepID=UPI003C73A219